MHFYTASPLSLGYIPRGSYRPAPVSYLDDGSTFALPFEGLGYPAVSHTFSPQPDAETRYRRALHELQAAEEEFEAHLTLKRARQTAVLREQAVYRERALAFQAEVERIERERALQAKLAEEYERRQRASQAQFALDRAHCQKHALLNTLVDADSGDLFASERAFAKKRLGHRGPSSHPVLRDSEVPTFEGLLRLFTGAHPQPRSPLQPSDSPAHPRHPSSEPQPSEKQDTGADALNAVLEFIHSLAAHAGDAAGGSQTTPEARPVPHPVPQPQAAPADEKGKGKAKAEPAVGPTLGPTLLQTLLGAHTQGPSDQELRDIEPAIELSLKDRGAADAKKASVAKAARSNPGASSSRVKLDGTVPSGETPSSASDTTSATSEPIPGPVPQPVSPLTTIRAVRNRLSALESTFKLPAVLDFDRSVLTVSPNNAPLRAYENTLNGLLEQLDAIESDGNEEVRSVRREVVREVEKALEDLEGMVSEKAPKLQVTRDVEVKGYDIEAEEPEVLVAQDAVPADAPLVAKGAEPTGLEPSAAVLPTDTDVDTAISEEYFPSPPTVGHSKPAVAEPDDKAAAQTADEDVSSLDADKTAPVMKDSSDSVATITANTGPSSDTHALAPPVPETFLASMSHDQFTFPPKPTYSETDASPAGAQDDAVLVDNSEEGESAKSGEDGWSEVDA